MDLFDLAAKLSIDSSDYEEGIKDAEKQTEKLAGVIESAGKSADKLDDGLDGAEKAVKDYANETEKADNKTNVFSGSVEDATQKANGFARKLNGAADKILKVGAAAAGVGIAGFAAFAKSAVSTGQQFDAAMSQVAATMGVSIDSIQDLRDYAQKMGAETAFSANEAAQALNYMALAGYDAETSMQMLPNVLNLAAAGGMDLALASDMITDSQSALGLSLNETSKLVDKMAKAASKSNTSVSQLGDAILTVGGTAKSLKGGTTELATALGILADNGIKGAEGGTALRNILTAITAPGDKAKKLMDKLGVSAYDSSGNMRSLNDIFVDLRGSLDKMSQKKRAKVISTIFNARDMKSAEALIANVGDRWNELSGYIDEAHGAAQEMADTQLDNLTGDITLMNSALEGAKIAFSDGITPALRDVVKTVTNALSKQKTQSFLKEVGEGLGKVIDFLSQLASKVLLPKVISLFENGGEKIKTFGGVLAGVVGAIKAANIATGLLAGTLSPSGVLIKGLGLVIGALSAAGLAAETYYSSLHYLNDEQRELVDRADEIHENREAARSAYEESAAAALKERDATTELWKELQLLVDEDGKVLEGNQSRVDFILGELNNALGTEYSRNGDIIDQYKTMQGEIDNLIQKRAAESLMTAGQDQYTQALTQRQDALMTAAQLYDQLRVAQADLRKAEEAEAEFWKANQKAYNEANEEGEDAILRRSQAVTNARYSAEKAFNEISEKYKQANADAAGYYETVEKYENAQSALLDGNYKKAIDLMAKDYASSLDYYIKKGKLNAKEVADFQEKLKKQEGYVAQYRRNYIAGMAGFTKPVLDELEKQVSEARRIGNNIGKATGDGVGAFAKYAAQKARALVSSMFGAMRNEAQIASPSKVATKYGKYIGEGLINGMDATGAMAERAASDLMSSALSPMNVGADYTGNLANRSDSRYSSKYYVGDTMIEIKNLLKEIRENLGFDVVLSDGTIAGRIDKILGTRALQKARGN